MKIKLIRSLPVLAAVLIASAAFCQPPSKDIFLISWRGEPDQPRIVSVENVTRREGYDNQPFFNPNGESLLYTANLDNQTEIFQYRIPEKQTNRLTHTPESEYSPTVMPDGSGFSTVRVEQDSSQRLWYFPWSDSAQPRVLLPDVKPVGYHAWGDHNTVALFILGDPHTLHIAHLTTGKSHRVAENIDRSMHKIPGRAAFSFTQWHGKELRVTEIDLKGKNLKTLVTALVKNEEQSRDTAWTRDGLILMGQGSSLFWMKPGSSRSWQIWLDLTKNGVHNITRIAVSPSSNLVAVVADDSSSEQ